ncbi:MAG: hypothetical protein ACI4I2_10185 [Oscillospiraceae bacterium]
MDISILKDGFGIHTFMLTYTNLEKTEYERLFELLKYSIIEKSSNYSYIKSKQLFIEGYYGIYPKLYDRGDHRYLRIFVNPRNLLEGKSCTYDIWGRNGVEKIKQLVLKIDEALKFLSDEYHIYAFENAYLSRVDLCVNYAFDNSYITGQYLRIAKKSVRKDKGKIRRMYINDRFDYIGDNHHLGFKGSSFELTIYDKSFQLMRDGKIPNYNDDYGNVLRIEVKMHKRLINIYTNSMRNNIEKLIFLLTRSQEIMIKSVDKVFYPGNYYLVGMIKGIIDDQDYRSRTKWLMSEVLSDRKNIDLMYYEVMTENHLSKKDIQRIKKRFKDLDINPTEIPMEDAKKGEINLLGFANLLMYFDDSKQIQEKAEPGTESEVRDNLIVQ